MTSRFMGYLALALTISFRAASAQTPAHIPLRGHRADVVANYDSLAQLEIADQRQVYSAQDDTVREDLWSLHFERILNDNPNLTAEQRAVVFEALGLVQSGVLEINHAAPEWQPFVDAAVADLNRHARQVLTPAMARTLLLELVPTPSHKTTGSSGHFQTSPLPSIRSELRSDPCDCSSQSNWCDFVTNPDNNCKGPCRAQEGCGTLWLYSCDGLCQ